MRPESDYSQGWQILRWRILLLSGMAIAAVGCRSTPAPQPPVVGRTSADLSTAAAEPEAHEVQRPVVPDTDSHDSGDQIVAASAESVVALFEHDDHSPPPWPEQTLAEEETAPLEVLNLDQLVAEVLAVNPSVEAMQSAWRAAAMKYPQVTALDDPMFGVALGPGTWGNRSVDSAYMVMASQKFPWPGKLELRGAVANAEANAASRDVQDIRLQLAELTRLSYIEYWQSHRELELNAENIQEVRQFRDTAEAKLRANLVTQQDVLQADVELALLERRKLELDRQTRVAIARINTLLHRDAALWLAPPPQTLEGMGEMPVAESLVTIALQQRPDLVAMADRIQADRAHIALACKDYYPDFDAYFKYDAFWQEAPLRPMIGVNLNVPLNQGRRQAAVHEAQSNLHRHSAEYARLADEIANQVHALIEHLNEATSTVDLYNSQIIPAAEKNVASAQAGYVAGRVDFLRLIEAQRQLIQLREQRVQAEASVLSRRTEVQRAAALFTSI